MSYPPHAADGPPPPQVPSAGTPGVPLLTAIVAAVVAVAALYVAREVLLPITLAMLLSFLLSPLVELLRRAWLGRVLSVFVAVILALGIILALGSAIGTQVAQLAKNVPQYQSTIEQKITHLRETTINRFSATLDRIGHQLSGAGGAAPASPPQAQPANTGESATQQEKPVPVVMVQPPPSALEIGEKIVGPILNPLATAGIILVVTIFTLLQKEDLRDRVIRLFGAGDLERTTLALDDAGRRLSRYFLTQLGINTSFGVIVAIGLYFIGLPSPVLWGILGALLRFIPYIGAWIAAAVPVVLAAAVEPGWSMAIWTAVLYAGTEAIVGQLVEPLVYGHSTGLSPVAVVIAAIFWTWIWGPIGLIISTPLTLCLVVLGRYVERLEFLDVMFGDRPALSPAESFYQRILAGDPDEAVEQAERYLKDRPLSAYYDEVAVKGLELAASDLRRGIMTAEKVERLNGSVAELVRELGAYGNGAAPPDDEDNGDARATRWLAPAWRGEEPILCVAGRGPLDEAAAAMLAQLLGKHGLGARVVPHEQVSRRSIAALAVSEVAMVCVVYVDLSGNPAQLRYLLRRLRERRPEASLLVGLWPENDPILRDEALQRELGADYYVSTLQDAVATCVAAAGPHPPRRVQAAPHARPG